MLPPDAGLALMQERAKREVAGMAKIHIEQQMEKELQKAEWEPRMLLQRRKKKQVQAVSG